jgi:hypothetical protein
MATELPVGEGAILDVIFEALPEDGEFGVTLYPVRDTLPRPEMYITAPDGSCWKITAEEHSHPKAVL